MRSRRAGERTARRALWLVPAAFLAHCAEELPAFPEWATRHFGTTTTRFYIASHCVLIPAMLGLVASAARRPARRGATTLAAAVAFGLIANAGFHALAMRRFGEYSPGIVTGVGVMVPASAYALWRLRRAGMLGTDDLLLAAVLGAGFNAAAVGSLRLDAPKLGG